MDRLLVAVLLSCALTGQPGAQSVAGGKNARRTLEAPIGLDFRTEDDFSTPLANGQAIAWPGEFGRLVTISSSGPNAGPAIFDSTPGGPNGPGPHGLLVARGNVLILQDSQAPTQTTPGVFDDPDDDPDGGELLFDFTAALEPSSIALVDIGSGTSLHTSVTLVDDRGRTRVYDVPPGWTRDLVADGPPGWDRLDLESVLPQPGFQSTATATEQPAFDSHHVVRLIVGLGGHGAVDDIRWRPGRSVGMAANDYDNSVIVFDADRDRVLGTVVLPQVMNAKARDCVVDARRGLGYVTDLRNHVWVIDLQHSPPELAAGVNPISISNFGADLSLSPDGRYLATSVFVTNLPLSIVDLTTRVEVGRAFTPRESGTIEFATNDTLVGTRSSVEDRLMRFSMDSAGHPSLVQEVSYTHRLMNVAVAPGGRIGIVATDYPLQLTTFEVDTLAGVTTVDVVHEGGVGGPSVIVSPDGRTCFVRLANAGRGIDALQALALDPSTGDLSHAALYTIELGSTPPAAYDGVETTATHPDGSRLYIALPEAIGVYDAGSGAQLHTIPVPRMVPAGLAVAGGVH